jgi:hypothetical protein
VGYLGIISSKSGFVKKLLPPIGNKCRQADTYFRSEGVLEIFKIQDNLFQYIKYTNVNKWVAFENKHVLSCKDNPFQSIKYTQV